MGCAASSSETENKKDDKSIVPEASGPSTKPEGEEEKPLAKKSTVKLSKGQQAALKKKQEEEEQEEKKKKMMQSKKISKAPPPPVRMTKAAQRLAESRKRPEQIKLVGGSALGSRKSTLTTTTTPLKSSNSNSTFSTSKSPKGTTPAPSPTARKKSTSTTSSNASSPKNPLSANNRTTKTSSSSADFGPTASSQSFGMTNSISLVSQESMLLLNETDFEGFQKMKLLGKGAFGSTYEAGLKSMKIVCVKVIEFGGIADPDDVLALRDEIHLMKRLCHPNIVQYYGCTENDDDKTINIFMEYVTGGSLNHYIKKFTAAAKANDSSSTTSTGVPIDAARNWCRQILEGVEYLHNEGIVHRDIKGANILVTNNGELKLADFGCSKSVDDAVSRTQGCQTMVGTPYWMAPEVLKCEPYGTKADIWSVGCTIVEIVTGKPAWPEMDNMWAAVYKIANSSGLPPNVPKDLPKPMMKFLERCFERNPNKRASATELLKMPFFQE